RGDRVHHVNHLAGGAAVAAVIGGRPGPRHVVVLRATARRRHVGEGQRRAGVAGVGRRRGGKTGRRRAFNGRRSGQRRDHRGDRVHHVNHLAGGAAVAAVIGGRPGPRHVVVLRATARRRHVGEGQCRAGVAGVGRWSGQRRDPRGDRVHHVNHLAGGAAVAAVIGGRPGPRHVVVLRATARRRHVGYRQGGLRVAGVGRRRGGKTGRRRAFNGRR